MNTTIIIQARMNASRLPGKVLKTVFDKPLLEHQIDRLKLVRSVQQIVVATTTNSVDQALVTFCKSKSIPCFQGSETDVLSRYYEAAMTHSSDVIVRITADCPIIDFEVVDRVVQYYLNNTERFDYVSNVFRRTYPRGMDTEVFSFENLEVAHKQTTLESDREHVTPFFYRQPELFRIGNVTSEVDYSHHRWTVDTEEDLELITKIIHTCYSESPVFGMNATLRCFEQHPEWIKINQHIKQKKT